MLIFENSNNVLIGGGGTNVNGQYALISDAPAIDPVLYQNNLAISFHQNAVIHANSNLNWRVLVTVGSAIYASNLFPATTEATTVNVNVADAVWSLWNNETNLSNGFSITGTNGISETTGNLPAGSISNIGLLAIDGPDSNDRFRLYEFSITGTAISEPFSRLEIAPATAPASGFELKWNSQAGKLYNLRTSTDLGGAISSWTLLEGDIVATPPANVENVPQDDPRRFYAIEEFETVPPQ